MDHPAEESSKKRKLEDEAEEEDEEEEDDDDDNIDDNGSGSPMPQEDLRKLLEPLNKEQLISLLVSAGSQYSAVAEEIRDVASKDPAHRKLFVRGLAWETTSQNLLDVFSQYGEVEEGAVIVDKVTNKSRGFGFITYKHMDSAQRALKEPSKSIDMTFSEPPVSLHSEPKIQLGLALVQGRITVCNLATSGTMGPSGTDISQRKLYIGGLSFDTTSETVLKIFSQYGEIEEGAVAYDKNSNKSRGFAFVTFKTGEAARKAIEDTNKTIEGRHVTVKLALDGQKEKPAGLTPQGHGYTQAQHAYSAVNPNLAAYSRQPQAGAGLGISAYSPGLGFSGQSAYAGLTASQYGAVLPGASQQYAQYGFP